MHYLRQGRGFYRSAIALMLPMILQNLVTNFMALADSFMVGALGETELAAVMKEVRRLLADMKQEEGDAE